MTSISVLALTRVINKLAPSRGEDWRTRAECAKPGRDPDWWYSYDPNEQWAAQRICGACPVRDECETAAKSEKHGIWAGKDKHRPRLETCKTCDREMRPKGTPAGKHPGAVSRQREGLCDACYRRDNHPRITTPPVKPGQPCADCKRPLRPRRFTLDDHPGTFRHGGRGRCDTCYTNLLKTKEQTK